MRGAMKHWSPDTFAPLGPRTGSRAREMRRAARVGLALVAAACIGTAIGAHALLASPEPVDRAALTG